ncbi:hypothetical protein Acr_14g0005680 [Actinidia rufa]|uniref:Retrotransposon gag domain-containing protein n=1 Tax=Actinidia rufa TaxID=165716 RepID=A0A7J0FQD5_9ERIC|nr:hypothetical protein Acr_14g0005680 [Actinidia rufa]
MVNTRANGQGDRENENTNTQMNELRDMVQALVGAMAAQQQLFQQYMQPPQPPQGRDQYSGGGENRQQGETSEYREETEDPAISVENVTVRQKVEIGSYLLTGEANRWWNLKGVREPMMNWARFKVIFREKFVPRAVQNAKSAEFERLKQMGTTIAEYEASFTNLLMLDRAIIVEQDETERKNYFDSKRKKNFNNEGMSGQKKQKPDVNSKNQGIIRVGKYRCARSVGNTIGESAGETELKASEPRNRGGGGNEQRQGQVFTLMPGDARNNEDVVAGTIPHGSWGVKGAEVTTTKLLDRVSYDRVHHHEERPVRIMDSRVKQLRSKRIPLVKSGERIRRRKKQLGKGERYAAKYPYLFEQGLMKPVSTFEGYSLGI